MKKSISIGMVAVAANLIAGTVQADKWSDQFPHIKNTHAVPVMGEPTAMHAEQFSTLTGAEVNVIHTLTGDLYSKAMMLRHHRPDRRGWSRKSVGES